MTKSVMHAQRLARHFMEFSELQQPGRAIGEVLLARTLIATGEFDLATSLLRQSAAALAETGYSWGPLALMYLAQALGQQGDAAGSAEILARAESRHSLRSELYAPELALGRAWTLAAARNMTGAISAARDAARIAERSGQLAIALQALHEAVRLGDVTAADAIARVAGGLDCVAGRSRTGARPCTGRRRRQGTDCRRCRTCRPRHEVRRGRRRRAGGQGVRRPPRAQG